MNNEGYQGEECRINTEEGKMVRAKECSIAKAMVAGTETAIKELIKKEYIRESRSEWTNPVRPVVKPNGTIGLCMNMMALNELVKYDGTE